MDEHAAWLAAADPRRRIGHAVEAHLQIGSTNDRARELVGEGRDGIAVVAEEQVAGRGRRGRTWSSPPGVNLMVSVGIRPHLAAADAWQLGQAVALAAREACGAVAGTELKWPNDLVATDGRKLGGILVETALDGDRVAIAVLGIGVNVNWPIEAMPEEIRDSATSLQALSGAPVDRVALLDRLLGALDEEVAAVEAGRSPLERYRAACRTLGAQVVVVTGGESVSGRAVDLDETGGLVVDTDAGRRRTVASGEVVRVRPVVPA
jgi:BirA family transcriptional regulator, biotin operon repressor / biotin---[acetyl-CoA-carboxylase] ligase